MKEMKIRINSTLHKDLAKVARKSDRSVSKQVTVYIKQGIEADRGNGEKARA